MLKYFKIIFFASVPVSSHHFMENCFSFTPVQLMCTIQSEFTFIIQIKIRLTRMHFWTLEPEPELYVMLAVSYGSQDTRQARAGHG